MATASTTTATPTSRPTSSSPIPRSTSPTRAMTRIARRKQKDREHLYLARRPGHRHRCHAGRRGAGSLACLLCCPTKSGRWPARHCGSAEADPRRPDQAVSEHYSATEVREHAPTGYMAAAGRQLRHRPATLRGLHPRLEPQGRRRYRVEAERYGHAPVAEPFRFVHQQRPHLYLGRQAHRRARHQELPADVTAAWVPARRPIGPFISSLDVPTQSASA